MPPKPTWARPLRGWWSTGPTEGGHDEYADTAEDEARGACRFRNISVVGSRKQAAFQPEQALHIPGRARLRASAR